MTVTRADTPVISKKERCIDERCNTLTFAKEELLRAAAGTLFGRFTPRLPSPPLLAFDEVWDLTSTGGTYGLGGASARVDVMRFAWAFECHFLNDPVMPGTLMLDALFQLTGLYGATLGFEGRGRAAGTQRLRIVSEVLPSSGSLFYRLDIRRVSKSRQLIVADGSASCGKAMCLLAKGLLTATIPYGPK